MKEEERSVWMSGREVVVVEEAVVCLEIERGAGAGVKVCVTVAWVTEDAGVPRRLREP